MFDPHRPHALPYLTRWWITLEYVMECPRKLGQNNVTT